jgi:cytochrome c553
MAKSIRVYTKKQRAESAGTMVGVRLQPDQLTALDAWIEHQPDTLSRPEAVRRLIEKGLKGQ